MAIKNLSSIQGTVQTLECRRDGDLRWSKLVWIPTDETTEAYSTYNGKRYGAFVYFLTGNPKSYQVKPRGVPLWSNL